MTTALREDIHWVGAVDWDCREFHSFETPHGVTYNSYLILDEKPALIDTVKAPFACSKFQNPEPEPLVPPHRNRLAWPVPWLL